MPGNVEQNPSANDPVFGEVVHAQPTIQTRGVLFRRPVVEAVLRMPNVTQPIPLAGVLCVEAVQAIVLGEATTDALNAMIRPFAPWKEGPRWQIQRQIEVEHDTTLDQCGGMRTAFRCQEVERAQLIVATKDAPRRARRRVRANGQILIARD